MVHKCFTYVMLASIIASQVMAAPTPQVSGESDNSAWCRDTSVSWEEKINVCQICLIPDLPKELSKGQCGGGSGPGTHQMAPGVWRRETADASSKEPQGGRARAHEMDGRIYTRDTTLPTSQEPEDAVTNSDDSGDNAASGILSEPKVQLKATHDIITHKPAPGIWRRKVTNLPFAPITHVQASDVSGGAETPNSGKKRETNTFDESSKDKQQVERVKEPTDVVVAYRSTEQDSILHRRQDSSSSSSTETPQASEGFVGITPESTEPPAPDSIQATADRLKSLYGFSLNFTPATVHAAASDVHRREERV